MIIGKISVIIGMLKNALREARCTAVHYRVDVVFIALCGFLCCFVGLKSSMSAM